MTAERRPGGRRAYHALALVGVAVLVGAIVMFATRDAGDRPVARAAPERVVPERAPGLRPTPAAPAAELPIAGWVIDGAAVPIEGVTITVRDAANVVAGEPAESEADGAFRLAVPERGEHTLFLEGDEVFPAEVRWQHGAPPPRIMLSRRMSLDVRVTGGGAPVEGAEVHLSDGSSPTLATELTDADGVARFDDLLPGPYELWARAGGQASPLVRLVHAGPDPHASAELALAPAGRVDVRVAGDGLAPASASVALIPVDVDHAVRIAVPDPSGQISFDGVPRGRWRLEAEAPGYFQGGEELVDVAGAPESRELRLVRAGVVSGTVVDAAGAPVANATLVLRGQGLVRPVAERRDALAPARLRWIHPLAGARLLPRTGFGRFGGPRPGTRPAECGRGHCGVDLAGRRGAVVHAAADGVVALVFTEIRKEAGRYVAIDHPGGLRSYYMHLDDIRDDLELGQVVRGGDPIGTVGRTGVVKDAPHLHFSIAQDRGDRAWYVDPEPILQHAVVLPAARTLEAAPGGAAAPTVIATVRAPVADGAPAAPAAPAARLNSDAAGRFRLEGVSPGDYVAVAFHAELAPGASDRFAVRAGEETGGVTIALTPGVIVAGRVRDLHGAVAGARIVAEEGSGVTRHKVATTFSDQYGDFELRALSGAVTLTVTAVGRGEVARDLELDGRGAARERRREDFELIIEDGKLFGEVLDPDGHAAAAVDVRIVDGPTRRRRVTTDAQGRFAIEPVAPGAYVVELTSPAHPRSRATLVADRWKELRLEQGGAIALELRDAHTSAPLAGIRVDADGPGDRHASAVTDARGLAGLVGLVPGAWTLRARTAGYRAGELRVDVAAAPAPREARLELSRGALLAGVVRDSYGRRVAGAKVRVGTVATRTDADGNFRLADTPTGPIELVAEHDGARGTLALEVAPGDEHVTLKLDLAAE